MISIKEFLVIGVSVVLCLFFIVSFVKFLIEVLKENKKIKRLKKMDKSYIILTSEKNYFDKK